MKNQYFADINDYRKYGLLRILAGDGQMKIAVCWMLTENDGKTDGKFISYLKDPDRWRKYDPVLFDVLTLCIKNQVNRSVKYAEDNQLIPSAVYFSDRLKDNRSDRERYFQRFKDCTAGSELVFFDPDNGIEVPSVKFGRKDSRKYIYWQEITDAFTTGRSVLIYQHFPRIEREMFVQKLIGQFSTKFPVATSFSFSTPNTVFLLISQPHRRQYFEEKFHETVTAWDLNSKYGNTNCVNLNRFAYFKNIHEY